MYHATMFPHVVVQVGQQGHYHPLLDASHRQNRGVAGPIAHYEQGGSSPIELFQLFGIDNLRNSLNFNGRSIPNSPSHSSGNSNSGTANNSNNNKSSNGQWRIPVNVMGPPPPAIQRPANNYPIKKGYWNKRSHRLGSNNFDAVNQGSSNECYSSDSGFSSRSPTPSNQQVSASSCKSSSSSNDDDAASASGEPAPAKPVRFKPLASGVENSHNKRQDCYPNFYPPYFPHGEYMGQLGVHQGCSPHFPPTHHQRHSHPQQHHHHHQQQQSLPGFHHSHLLQPSTQRRCESLTNLNQQGLANNHQSKRRYSSRHSPPASFKNSSRGRRTPSGTMTHSTSGFSAPDRFLQRSHLIYITTKPVDLLSGNDWDEVSGAMWDKFVQNQQTENMYRNKMDLWKKLFHHIKDFYPKYGLFLVGSTISGFGSNKSDMDMCLLVRHSEMDQRIEAVGHLERVLKCLRQCSFIENADLIQAKVPILKFKDAEHGLEVDLNCNNAVGIRNTHMLFCYSQMDWRVRPLVLIVKLWAASQGINDAKNMTISSYSLVLMVINFLQCGVSPPVLPCLHRLHPSKFQPHTDLHFIDLHEELIPIKSENNQALGELFAAFLEYYAQFDYTKNAVSVRTGGCLPIEECRHARSFKNDPHQWKYLCIEEPFDLTNTAHSVYDPEVFEKIKSTFRTSFEILNDSRSLERVFSASESS
ncbi:Poly(A) RNA polymerase gld-2-like protein A [Frankliniella fusca]|uniref:Poly(A) RNA polymerase gld-2-like protein A n=1 Tax=Frankliniella fusca TaxID=407009 RepID=A0AAE1HUQ7_9NEOP|nr:Poly(A) RNA polymerase gld-2-like protein A [Frankliniella fusca]